MDASISELIHFGPLMGSRDATVNPAAGTAACSSGLALTPQVIKQGDERQSMSTSAAAVLLCSCTGEETAAVLL